ncbi:MAG: hypothetical protein EOO75_03475, partial [Myxococcales bacterium]
MLTPSRLRPALLLSLLSLAGSALVTATPGVAEGCGGAPPELLTPLTTQIPPNGALAYHFSYVNQPKVEVTDAQGHPVAGTIQAFGDGLVWRPTAPLLPSALYDAVVSSAYVSLSHSFSTTSSDAALTTTLPAHCGALRPATMATYEEVPQTSCQVSPMSCNNRLYFPLSEHSEGTDAVVRWQPPSGVGSPGGGLVAYHFLTPGQSPGPQTRRVAWDAGTQLTALLAASPVESVCYRVVAENLVTDETLEGPETCLALDPGAPPRSVLDG